jgi:predicted AAA+ superfamily ATPase
LFLLGPRQTGKSTLLKTQFPHAIYIDLLHNDTFRMLSRAPETLRELVTSSQNIVIIDEVQKLPVLLDEVQALIDRDSDLRFILTGSSARKLKRGAANLLGGRALFYSLHPLVSKEVAFDRLEDQLCRGSMPGILDSELYWEDLKAYVGSYLREEIQAEGLTRSIENFSRFLDFCAHLNGEQMNYTKIGNDADISPRTIKDYVKILEDTLVGYCVPPFRSKSGRKTVATEKFYLFDVGVAHALLGRKSIERGTPDFGKALEHYVFLELKAKIDYGRFDQKISYWRTQNQLEVDFVLDDSIAIEVKGTGRVTASDLKGLIAIKEDLPIKRAILVCTESHKRITESGIEIIPIGEFCRELWQFDDRLLS